MKDGRENNKQMDSSNSETISILMITYNHEKYISRAIEGVLKQKTEYSYKLLIGEDCSTDSTRKIIDDYIKKNPDKIKLITSESNVGMMENAVRLLKASQGKYVALCEGDDEWTDPQKLQKQVDFLESHPDYVMCSHAVKTVFLGVTEEDPFVEPLISSSFNDILLHGHFIPTLSILYKREALPIVPEWYKELLDGDIPLILLITHYGKNYYMKDVMGLKRKHPGGITQQKERKIAEWKKKNIEYLIFLYKNLNSHFNNEHKEVLNPKIARLYVHNMYFAFKDFNFMKSIIYFFYSLRYSPFEFFSVIGNKIKK